MHKLNVIEAFRDKNSGKHFTKGGLFVSEDIERITFLIEKGFLEQKKIFIENAEQEVVKVEIEHVGGGFYKLPNGEKVKGKKQAHQRWGEIDARRD